MGRHVLLGGSGTIGRAACPHLVAAGHDVSIVQRHPAAVTGRETLVAADALDVEALARAAEGADVLYCVVGLPYDSRIWRRDFPRVVGNAVEAARRTGARLVYFDNVYSYGPVEGWMTEDCPIRPTTEKGLARAECARIVMEAVERQGLRACIARSADFYGDYPQFDMIGDWGVQLKRGKPALALYRDDRLHSLTYIPDNGRALAFLGETPEADGAIWHMPTDPEPRTARQTLQLIAEILGARARHITLPKPLVQAIALFNPLLREVDKMSYQLERDYRFSSEKITRRFGLTATPFAQGVREHLAAKGLIEA
ncbi:NAD-dependent epimerase/dehydratase family protein [Phenylobacterium sp.]|uniref:NAD-dependent epimerase/dehydratase family protein n=1 Tax=Phenylobacterium sp. TaxID=1871053 RepID=UPI0025E8932F|nr:NAD-dependent epimerase/dehydratase family protein [Phenylobacterium sp.]MCA3713880.1 NAD(P)H-binding protein [Phenylobacterium sp.]